MCVSEFIDAFSVHYINFWQRFDAVSYTHLFAHRVVTPVKVPVINPDIPKRDIGRNNIEVAVIIRLYGLETLYVDVYKRQRQYYL